MNLNLGWRRSPKPSSRAARPIRKHTPLPHLVREIPKPHSTSCAGDRDYGYSTRLDRALAKTVGAAIHLRARLDVGEVRKSTIYGAPTAGSL